MKANCTRLLFISLCLPFWCSVANAQGCRLDFTPNYAIYENVSSDGTYIYTSVLVAGSTTGSGSAACNPNNVTHTPKAYNKIGTVGGWVTGTPGHMNSYSSVQNNQDILGGPGIIYLDASGEIDCSMFGTFWTGGFNPKAIRLTTTYWGPPPIDSDGECYYTTTACRNNTTPTCRSSKFGGALLSASPTCPNWVRGSYAVIDGVCTFAFGFPQKEGEEGGPCT